MVQILAKTRISKRMHFINIEPIPFVSSLRAFKETEHYRIIGHSTSATPLRHPSLPLVICRAVARTSSLSYSAQVYRGFLPSTSKPLARFHSANICNLSLHKDLSSSPDCFYHFFCRFRFGTSIIYLLSFRTVLHLLSLSSCLFRVCINSSIALQNIHRFFSYIYLLFAHDTLRDKTEYFCFIVQPSQSTYPFQECFRSLIHSTTPRDTLPASFCLIFSCLPCFDLARVIHASQSFCISKIQSLLVTTLLQSHPSQITVSSCRIQIYVCIFQYSSVPSFFASSFSFLNQRYLSNSMCIIVSYT